MKKIVSLILVMATMLSLYVPVKAAEKGLGTYRDYEEFEYVDSFGEKFRAVSYKDDEKTVAIVYDSQGNMIVKSERAFGSDYIIETVTEEVAGRNALNTEGTTATRVINIKDMQVPWSGSPLDSMNTPSYGVMATDTGDTVPGSTAYKKYKTYNTDYLYQGEILTGDGYFRKTSATPVTSNRISYNWVRNTTINTIFLILSGYYSWVTLSTTKQIIIGLGIGIAGASMTSDLHYRGEVETYTFQFKCQMDYNGRSIKMSEITKKFDYLLSKDILLGTTNRTFDNFSYSTPDQAVNMCCKEAVGYAAQAFSAKYITGSKPNLSLPVSGPVW